MLREVAVWELEYVVSESNIALDLRAISGRACFVLNCSIRYRSVEYYMVANIATSTNMTED